MKSMTGFGGGNSHLAGAQFEVEIKTVNHRFLDLQLRLPRELQAFELPLRQAIKAVVQRGRVECWVKVNREGPSQQSLVINWELLDQLVLALNQAKSERYAGLDFAPAQLLAGLSSQADFFQVVTNETTETDLLPALMVAVEAALQQLDHSRSQEGEHLQLVLQTYLADFETELAQVASFAPLYAAEHQQKLLQKVTEFAGSEVEQSRILTEVALLLERGDIQEELDRSRIHLGKFKELLQATSAVGREADFLLQEMNREINTIGSKSSPIEIKESVVQLKTILEKIREQIQNVE